MDESKILEECVNISLTPLQTILLSKTLIVTNTLIDFLLANNCMDIEEIKNDSSEIPVFEQTGNILIKSAVAAMKEVCDKIWESGREEIGEEIPEEFEEVILVYSTVVEQIAIQFVKSLKK